MKKIGILVFVIIITALVTAVQAEIRAGGLSEVKIDESIADCGISPIFKEPVVDIATAPQPVPIEKPRYMETVSTQTPAPVPETVSMKKKIIISLNIEFNTKKIFVKEKYYDDIKRVADFMKENPDSICEIQGHTDNVGNKAYNKALSEKRSESVRQYIIDKFGIDGKRITAVGFGGEIPIASNDTEEGRQKNRRVEAVIDARE